MGFWSTKGSGSRSPVPTSLWIFLGIQPVTIFLDKIWQKLNLKHPSANPHLWRGPSCDASIPPVLNHSISASKILHFAATSRFCCRFFSQTPQPHRPPSSPARAARPSCRADGVQPRNQLELMQGTVDAHAVGEGAGATSTDLRTMFWNICCFGMVDEKNESMTVWRLLMSYNQNQSNIYYIYKLSIVFGVIFINLANYVLCITCSSKHLRQIWACAGLGSVYTFSEGILEH